MTRTRSLVAGLALALSGLGASAAPQLAAIFGDGMVLQREQPLTLWGRAEPGEALQIDLAGRRARATAGPDGRFRVTLRAAPAGGPHELRVRGRGEQVLRDVWLGDVWLASGQSNMEWSVKDAADAAREIAAADWPQIRHIKVARQASLRPESDIKPAAWSAARPVAVGAFSAVGYYFAREIHRATGVPIGIVNASWGGTHIETWTSPRAAAADPDLAPLLRRMPTDAAAFAAEHRRRQWAIVQQWQQTPAPETRTDAQWADPALDDAAWRTLQVPQVWEEQGLDGFDGHVWYRHSIELSAEQAAGAAELQLGAVDDCDETWLNGQRIGGLCEWDQPRRHAVPAGLLRPGRNVIAVKVTDGLGAGGFHGDAARVRLLTATGELPLAGVWKARVAAPIERAEALANDLPTLAFNGMLQPLQGLGLRGVIWYQGESNVERAARYGAAFRGLISDWRRHFERPQLPFHFVQLASFRPLAENTLAGSRWAELRDAQRQALSLPHTGMAVALDIGDADDIHPRNKQEAGRRLALLALRDAYGKTVVDRGPRLRSAVPRGDHLELSFQAPHGLAVRGGGTLQGFAVAEGDGPFHAAEAQLVGSLVRLRSAAVPRPTVARYGWFDNAGMANLTGRDGLPAEPFRTDRRPGLTDGQRFVIP